MSEPIFATEAEEAEYWRTVSLKMAEVEFTYVGKQWDAIRRGAAKAGYPTLRGFHMYMRMERLTWYDILEEESP